MNWPIELSFMCIGEGANSPLIDKSIIFSRPLLAKLTTPLLLLLLLLLLLSVDMKLALSLFQLKLNSQCAKIK